MVKSTYIVRITDGLPLSASVDDTEDETKLSHQKQQCKLISRKLTPNSEDRASIESGESTIHYLILNNVAYMCICDKSYPRKLSFSYLEEISREFDNSFGQEIHKPGLRPYAFVQFDNFMQKSKKVYQDTRATQNLDKLNSELQDVTRVMTKNIEDLLYRGDSLDKMADMSSSLRMESKKYKRAAQKINFDALIKQYVPIIGVSLIFLFLIWWMFF
ncbi:snare-like protein [Nadsonia fulvescens var. elongata DSM 6958]|uniref:Protein transport protein SEC22 n=1 Tax=Nadsonia fulvescens var. elongata DSM 6958 TaxID=857566 RepID=A0A1E3PN57_9ASCO|nr:snare-like protein [Nadsonia fulvescens var. elongata DSM 6958]